jgi:hypothetical protein
MDFISDSNEPSIVNLGSARVKDLKDIDMTLYSPMMGDGDQDLGLYFVVQGNEFKER